MSRTTDTLLDQTLDIIANLKDVQERLPKSSTAYFTVAWAAAAMKSVTAQLEAEQPKRNRAA